MISSSFPCTKLSTNLVVIFECNVNLVFNCLCVLAATLCFQLNIFRNFISELFLFMEKSFMFVMNTVFYLYKNVCIHQTLLNFSKGLTFFQRTVLVLIKCMFSNFWRSSVRTLEAVVRRCSVKRVFAKICQNWRENTCARSSFLIKLQALGRNFIKKETVMLVFSCEFWNFFIKHLFTEHLLWLFLEI